MLMSTLPLKGQSSLLRTSAPAPPSLTRRSLPICAPLTNLVRRSLPDGNVRNETLDNKGAFTRWRTLNPAWWSCAHARELTEKGRSDLLHSVAIASSPQIDLSGRRAPPSPTAWRSSADRR